MESIRQKKVGKLIHKEVVDYFLSQGKGMFGDSLVTVTGVRMTPDLSIAKVYLSFLPSTRKEDLLEKAEDQKSRIRGEIGKKLRSSLRKIPDFAFYHDDTAEYSQHINKILDSLDIPPSEEPEEN